MVGSLPANAGDTGSSPGLGRSRVPRSGWAREPRLLSLRVWSLCSATREAVIVRGPHTAMKSGPRLPQLEKALAQKRRPNIVINQSINLKKKKKNFQCYPVILGMKYEFFATIHKVVQDLALHTTCLNSPPPHSLCSLACQLCCFSPFSRSLLLLFHVECSSAEFSHSWLIFNLQCLTQLTDF